MQKVIDFYKQYSEDTRITIRHRTEFYATTYQLDSIIKGKDYMLDASCGTGVYSLYYAGFGCRVEAMDIVPEHIGILNARIADTNLNIDAHVGDARDLTLFASDTFDVVLNMGAIYHIEENEIPHCLEENFRVLKPGGYLAIAYVNKYKGYEDD